MDIQFGGVWSGPNSSDSLQLPQPSRRPTKEKPRKDRAIGRLTEKILAEFPYHPAPGESWEVCVEEIIEVLKAKRGSVYEIFHVFEALLLVTKIGTSAYKWNGFGHIEHTLGFLYHVAVKMGFREEYSRAKALEVKSLIKRETRPDDGPAASAKNSSSNGLHILQVCQKFVMIFLVAPPVSFTRKHSFSKSIYSGFFLCTLAKHKRSRKFRKPEFLDF